MKKRFLAIFIVVLMLFSQVAVFASDISLEDNSTSKITEELAEAMEQATDDEYIPIYIWLESYDDSMVYALLSKNLGITISKDTEESYIQAVTNEKIELLNTIQAELGQTSTMSFNVTNDVLSISDKADIIISQAEIAPVMSKTEIETCIESGMSAEEIISLSERNKFISDWRDTRKSLNELVNNTFYNKLDQSECRNIYVSSLLNYVRLECKKTYIFKLNNIYGVKAILYDGDNDLLEKTDYIEASNNVTYSATSNENLMTQINTLGYDGSGVKVGVLEYDEYNTNKNFDSSAPHLINANVVKYNSNASVDEFDHATKVLSVLCGKPVTVDNKTYKGIATNASMYYAYYNSSLEYDTRLDWLVTEKDVLVINFSFQHGQSTTYRITDRDLDELIMQYRVIVVKSSGNDTDITGPGLAYNAITVGEVSTRNIYNGKYVVTSTSGISEEGTLTNKPELVAFGTGIYMVYDVDGVNAVTEITPGGTSYAAPMVTGTIALMLQANPSLIGKPDSVKAILMSAADENAVYSSYDNSAITLSPYTSNHTVQTIKEASGAGLLNIPGSVSLALSNIMYRFSVPANEILEGTYIDVSELFIYYGATIEVTLVFEKTDNGTSTPLKNNFDLEIVNSGNVIMEADSNKNNAENFIINFNSDEDFISNYCQFRIKCTSLATTADFSSTDVICQDDVNVTLLISCGCAVPSANISSCTKDGHNIICSNSGLWAKEKHDYASTTQTYADATVKYEVYYKVRQFTGTSSDIICYYEAYPIIETTNSNNTSTYAQEMSYIENRVDKRWAQLNFDILIISPNNEVINNFISTVYINLYYDTGECNFEITN